MVKVLLVDDEPDVELLAKQKFRKQISNGDFDLLFALNGQEALDTIEREPDIAIVISDVNMPEMDGLTLLDRLKELSPSTKTIVVSAYGDAKTLRSAMNKGAFDFVTKPVDFKELSESIELALSKYQVPSSQLHSYQQLLKPNFPQQVNLIYSNDEKVVLWDAFSLKSEVIMMGVSSTTSPFPSEIVIAVTHGLLKSALMQEPTLSLTALEEKLREIIPSLEVQILVGRYNSQSHNFSYETNGQFKVGHGRELKALLKPAQKVLIGKEEITLEHPPSSSHLTLRSFSEA